MRGLDPASMMRRNEERRTSFTRRKASWIAGSGPAMTAERLWVRGSHPDTAGTLYRGEGWGEGDRTDRKDVTPHPPASGGRPLPMGEVKRACGTACIIGVNEASHHHVPDLAGVFADGAVGGEPAHARRVENRHAPPVARRAPQRVDLALRFPVGVEIGRDHEAV